MCVAYLNRRNSSFNRDLKPRSNRMKKLLFGAAGFVFLAAAVIMAYPVGG